LKNFSVIIFLIIFGTSCTFNPDNKHIEEIISSDQVVLDEINIQPTSFFVANQDDSASWVRARFFFQTYLSGQPQLSDKLFISDKKAKSTINYQVKREPQEEGTLYIVTCTNGINSQVTPEKLLLAAKNLARFIQKGELEVKNLN
jgi:hypothetical protein